MRIISFTLAILIGLCMVQPAAACTGCTIHNHLADSVWTSSNIVIAKIERAVSKETAQVRVIRTLRGESKPGEQRRMPMWFADGYIGQTFLMMDPDPSTMGFKSEVVPSDLEDEVRFLIRNQATPRAETAEETHGDDVIFSVKNLSAVGQELLQQTGGTLGSNAVQSVDEAVACAAGVSYETRAAGLAYIREHPQEAKPRIETAIENLGLRNKMDERVSFFSYRMEGLMLAALASEGAHATDYLLRTVRGLVDRTDEVSHVDGAAPSATVNAYILTAMLRYGRNDGWRYGSSSRDASARIKSELLKVFPTLRSQALADATYALEVSETATRDQMHDMLRGNDPDAYATGLYIAGMDHARFGPRIEAIKCLKAGRDVVRDPALRRMIEDGLHFARR